MTVHGSTGPTAIRASRNDLGEASMKTLTTLFTRLFAASLWVATSTCAQAADPPPPLKTTFDCAQAKASLEKLICRDPQLLQMDMELTRLYRLALTDERSVPAPDKIIVDQKFWALERNQCATDPEPKVCAIRRYAERAHQLRQGSVIVRTKDPDRLTEGPQTIRCPGLNTPIAATFFSTQPAVVYLKWANTSVTLSQVPSDAGARYSGKDRQGIYSFWQDGNTVLFQKPGSGQMSCTAEPEG
jgi:uncharacterized protein